MHSLDELTFTLKKGDKEKKGMGKKVHKQALIVILYKAASTCTVQNFIFFFLFKSKSLQSFDVLVFVWKQLFYRLEIASPTPTAFNQKTQYSKLNSPFHMSELKI